MLMRYAGMRHEASFTHFFQRDELVPAQHHTRCHLQALREAGRSWDHTYNSLLRKSAPVIDACDQSLTNTQKEWLWSTELAANVPQISRANFLKPFSEISPVKKKTALVVMPQKSHFRITLITREYALINFNDGKWFAITKKSALQNYKPSSTSFCL